MVGMRVGYECGLAVERAQRWRRRDQMTPPSLLTKRIEDF